MNEINYTERLIGDERENLISSNFEYKEQLIARNVTPGTRNFVFILFLISNVLISMDHGSIPASTNELRALTYYDQGIGLFGSLVYFGNILGSVIVFHIINKYNRKLILIISLIGNSVFLFTFVTSENIPFLLLNRVLVGVFQSYITIYLPVWSNQYGLQPRKNLMIALTQLVSPIGVFIGYLIASISISNQFYGTWKFAFVVQSISIVGLTIFILFIPSDYFSKSIFSYGEKVDDEYFIEKPEEEFKYSRVEINLSFMAKVRILWENKVFLYSVLGLSVLIYVATGVQYWMSDYINLKLGVTSLKDRLFLFTLVCFTSPTVGVLIGTYVKEILCKSSIRKSLIFCVVLGFISTIFSIFVPITNSIFYYILLMWLVLFFGGGIVPVATSIIINSVPEELAGCGNSVSNLFTNLFGYLPSPYIYSFLSDVTGDEGALGMKVTMWITVLGVVFLSLATFYSFKEIKLKYH